MYPTRSLVISLPEPLGEVANAVRAQEIRTREKLGYSIVEDEVNEAAMQACLTIARNQLEEALERHGDNAHLGGPDGIKYLLVNQRHLHKKGIMFTAFVFSTIIADMLGIEFVWTSDCKLFSSFSLVHSEVCRSFFCFVPRVRGCYPGAPAPRAQFPRFINKPF